MSFQRGVWRCAVAECGSPALVSVMVVAATPGKQRERIKKASKAVRLCGTDAREIASGKLPEPLRRAADEVLQLVTGETWHKKQARK